MGGGRFAPLGSVAHMPAPTLFQNEAANLTRSRRCSVELLAKCPSSRISVRFFILRLWPLLDRLGIEGQKCSGGGNRRRPRQNGNRVLEILGPQITLSTSAQAAAIRDSVHLSQRLTPRCT